MVRLDKFLANNGFGSRKDVKQLIKQKLVLVNDEIINDSAHKVDPLKDTIVIDKQPLVFENNVYIMMNKPQNVVSANKDNCYPTVIDLITEYAHKDLFCVGRLDVDTTGLMLIMDDGALAHQLLSPKNKVNKLYQARINGIITTEHINMFKAGIQLHDHTCLPAILKIIEQTTEESYVSITIMEGKFHQIKRMFEAIGFKVLSLQRIKIKNLELDSSLELGSYRLLSAAEVADLKN